MFVSHTKPNIKDPPACSPDVGTSADVRLSAGAPLALRFSKGLEARERLRVWLDLTFSFLPRPVGWLREALGARARTSQRVSQGNTSHE